MVADLGEPTELAAWLKRITVRTYNEGQDFDEESKMWTASSTEESQPSLSILSATTPHSRARLDASALNARLLENLHQQRRLQDALLDLDSLRSEGKIWNEQIDLRGDGRKNKI